MARWGIARQILDKAHVEITTKETERAKHAYFIVKDEVQVGQYDGIICISGDGLLHEVVNGLMHREDRD